MSQEVLSANSNTSLGISVRDRALWVRRYTTSFAVIGLLLFIYALFNLPQDKAGLLLFVLLAVLAETTSTELFDSSHSKVSMSSAIAIASIVALGPLAGVITYLASGIATALKAGTGDHRQRHSLITRTSFNVGMWAVTAFTAGNLYIFLGGIPGDVPKVSNMLPLVVITAFEYFLNVFILIGVISLQTGQRPGEIWRRDFQWQSWVAIVSGIVGSAILALAYDMFRIFGIVIVLLPVLSTSYAFRLYKNNMKDYVDGLEQLNRELKEAMLVVEKSNAELTEANQAIRRLNGELFQALARVFDMRDPYVGGHAAQVATYAVAIAAELNLPSDRIETIRRSAYLHDIGKLAIPEAILHKPGKLTAIEYEFIKKHADIGADLLASIEGLQHMVPFIRHHHERWDGRGYPFGIAGEEIPLEARILNLCDSVESMASDRPYHRGMSISAILKEIQDCSGKQFDPALIRVFTKLIQERGPSFVINSARSVTQQYAASLLANESMTHNMFEWILEKKVSKQPVEATSKLTTTQPVETGFISLGRQAFERHNIERFPLEF